MAKSLGPAEKLAAFTMIETQSNVEWLQRLARIPSVGSGNEHQDVYPTERTIGLAREDGPLNCG
jgi:hypothetical protein